ncbi:MAG TPA: hypothetical protein VH393_08170, partial [Ktedonobacterales bacterium]
MNGKQDVNSGQPSGVVWRVQTVRRFIGWIAVAFPLVLLFGYLEFEDPTQPDAISAYYYSHSMHTVFIVFLLVLGVSLIYYQFDTLENWVSTLAGLCVIGVVLCPMAPEKGALAWQQPLGASEWQDRVGAMHFVFAATAFGLLAVMSLFLFTRPTRPRLIEKPTPLLLQTRENVSAAIDKMPMLSKLPKTQAPPELTDLTKQKHWRNQLYEACGGIIIACLLVSFFELLNLVYIPLYWLETVMLWAFGAAWLVKGGAVPWLNDPADGAEGDKMAQQRWASLMGGLVGIIGIITGLVLLISPLLVQPGSDASWLGVTAPGKAIGYVMSMGGIRNVAAGSLLLWAAWQPAPAQPSFARPLTVVALAWGIVQAWDAVLLFLLPIPRIAIAAVLLALVSFVVVALTLSPSQGETVQVITGNGSEPSATSASSQQGASALASPSD